MALPLNKNGSWTRIVDVNPNGPFGKAGEPEGSVLVAIDGDYVLDVSHAHVIHALKQIQGTFEVTVAYVIDVEDDVPYFVPERL